MEPNFPACFKADDREVVGFSFFFKRRRFAVEISNAPISFFYIVTEIFNNQI